jgi:hypothetical protein
MMNLQNVGTVVDPSGRHATSGSADIWVLTESRLSPVIRHLENHGVEFVHGTVLTTGARAPLQSMHFYDPNDILIDISNALA